MDSEITALRRINLRAWVEKYRVPPKEKSLFSQLLGTGPFGERVARRLEREYGMGSNYLDSPQNGPVQAGMSGSAAMSVGATGTLTDPLDTLLAGLPPKDAEKLRLEITIAIAQARLAVISEQQAPPLPNSKAPKSA